jgi:hypothetical protein
MWTFLFGAFTANSFVILFFKDKPKSGGGSGSSGGNAANDDDAPPPTRFYLNIFFLNTKVRASVVFD